MMNSQMPVAYLSTVNVNPKSIQPIARCNLSPNDQVSSVLFSDKNSKRTVSVIAEGSFSLPPDKAKLTIQIKSSKANIEEAKYSVQRRYEYIYATLKKFKIKESEIAISKMYNRNNKLYEVINEITATLDDFKQLESLNNLIVEKLDTNVSVLEPKFSHSKIRIENIKRQASIQAIRNAKHIGIDLARSVGLNLAKPIIINEESCKEIEGSNSQSSSNELKKTISELVEDRTITVTVCLNVTFELKIGKKLDS